MAYTWLMHTVWDAHYYITLIRNTVLLLSSSLAVRRLPLRGRLALAAALATLRRPWFRCAPRLDVMICYDMIWHDMTWYRMTQCCTILNEIIGYGTTWHDMTRHDMIWYDMIWHDIIWYDMIWYDMTWHDMIRYDMIWYDMIWYDMTWHHTTCCCIAWDAVTLYVSSALTWTSFGPDGRGSGHRPGQRRPLPRGRAQRRGGDALDYNISIVIIIILTSRTIMVQIGSFIATITTGVLRPLPREGPAPRRRRPPELGVSLGRRRWLWVLFFIPWYPEISVAVSKSWKSLDILLKVFQSWDLPWYGCLWKKHSSGEEDTKKY